MARTAPVPNIPAPPGMNPGAFVAGGGGNGGGAGGKGAGNGSGNEAADGSEGDADAEGDGNTAADADSEGSGDPPCASHPSGGGAAAAGDPVDVLTGRVFTIPVDDLWLPGPLPFRFRRSYTSSARGRDQGLGYGWSHTLAMRIVKRRRWLELHKEDGTVVRCRIPKTTPMVTLDGWRLSRTPVGYEADRAGAWFEFQPSSPDSQVYVLARIRNRNGQALETVRNGAQVTGVIDSAGREIQLVRDNSERIRRLVVRSPEGHEWVFAQYNYDSAGDLIEVIDADGFRTQFTYRDHLLKTHAYATGLTFHFVYDRKCRCLESWGTYAPQPDLAWFADQSKTLADGVTRLKGILHCKLTYGDNGYVEVTDARSSQRYQGNAFGTANMAASGGAVTTTSYDARRHVTAVTDPEGLSTTWVKDERGRWLHVRDRLGRERSLQRDSAGRVVEDKDPRGFVRRREYDQRGNLVRETDARGNSWLHTYQAGFLQESINPLGGRTKVRWDSHGNLIEVVQPNGSKWTAEYDFLGRRVATTDPYGGVTRHTFSLRGDRLSTTLPNGDQTTMRYNAMHQVLAKVFPSGRMHQYEYGGYHRIARFTDAGGRVTSLQYDASNKLRRVINPAGDEHRFDVAPEGHLAGEETFDRRRTAYRYDTLGRLVSSESHGRGLANFEYDVEGQLVGREFTSPDSEDSIPHVFEYDAGGLVSAIASDDCRIEYERNEAGDVIQETHVRRDRTTWVRREYDAMGNWTLSETSEGFLRRVQRDSVGRIVHDSLGGYELDVERDASGLVSAVVLPNAQRLETTWDSLGRLSERKIKGGLPDVSLGAEPEWVGARPGAEAQSLTLHYRGEQLAETWSEKSQSFAYDRVGQLTEVRENDAITESYAYDVVGNITRKDGVTRSYRSVVLERVGADEFEFDDDGRLVTKRTAKGAWNYSWDPCGNLSKVLTPDGQRVGFEYDPLGRRTRKQVDRPGALGWDTVSDVQYVWFGEELIHEQDVKAPHGAVTYAQREPDDLVLAAYTPDSGWQVFVHGVGGFPDATISENGAVQAGPDRTAFGVTPQASDLKVRFPGQWYDAETGLCYNRYRYYDPELGRYLSPDPIGLYGGLNTYRYVENVPVSHADPNGLGCLVTISGSGNSSGVTAQSGSLNTSGPAGSEHHAPTNSTVQTALGNTEPRELWPVGTCAEPSAIDSFLTQARAQPGNENLSDADLLQQIPPGGIEIHHHGNATTGRRRPCQNCRQMLWELGIDPENDPRIAGNPRPASSVPLNPANFGRSLR
ncbi:MAG: hypothetical protein H6716_19925 [Polyangiaceae bacterium]|nr:hypothetical protein [Polyangiaceae bacterium]